MDAQPAIVFSLSVPAGATPAAVLALLQDPRTHPRWAGGQKGFRLLTMECPDPVTAGSVFTSTGDNGMGMVFHDTSTVGEAGPAVFAFTTESRLRRRHRPEWQARFEHRYAVVPAGTGCRIDYTARVYPRNYRPYWLHPVMRPMTGVMVPRMMRRNLERLAELASS